jgi:hypothetical protein
MCTETEPAAAPAITYSPDAVKALLHAAVWYTRLRQPSRVDRLLAIACDQVDNGGGLRDAGLNRVLDDYAARFRRLKRPVEASRLADLAQRIRNSLPGEFYPDGNDVPWWLQDRFLRAAPPLPLAYHSSHLGDVEGWHPIAGSALAFAVLVAISLPLMPWLQPALGSVFLCWIMASVVFGVTMRRRHKRALLRQSAESWVRVTTDGVEYHQPAQHCLFRWSEVKHLWTSWQSGPGEGDFYDSVVVAGPHESFEMSARFFHARTSSLGQRPVQVPFGPVDLRRRARTSRPLNADWRAGHGFRRHA